MIDIGYMDKDVAEKLKDKMDSATYMDFKVIIAPNPGGYHVSIESDYDASEQEKMEMFIFALAHEL